jgi:hypothetical protein
MNKYIVTTKQGVFYVQAWNEGKVMSLMSYEGYDVLSIEII